MARRAPVKGKIDPAAEFLEFFYPVHYQVGKALEEVLGSGQLNRKQVAMLWLIRAEGIQGHQIRRKDIQRLIATWFELSGSTVTLTAKGERFLTTMVEQGRNYIRPLLAKLSPEEIHNGLAFFRSGVLVLDNAGVGSLRTDTTSQEAAQQKA